MNYLQRVLATSGFIATMVTAPYASAADAPQTQPQVVITAPKPVENVSVGEVTNANAQYKFPVVSLHEKEFFVLDNPYQLDGELPFLLQAKVDLQGRDGKNARLRLSPLEGQAKRSARIVTDEVYVPTRVLSNGKPISRASFSTEGSYAVKATFKERDEQGALLNVSDLTADDVEYHINTRFIEPEGLKRVEYFFPRIAGDADSLPFCLIPVESSALDIDLGSGAITVENTVDGIFTLRSLPFSAYKDRAMQVESEKINVSKREADALETEQKEKTGMGEVQLQKNE